MVPITSLKYPQCANCKVEFSSMSAFDMHMKVVHGENENARINRLSQQVEEVVYPEVIHIKTI